MAALMVVVDLACASEVFSALGTPCESGPRLVARKLGFHLRIFFYQEVVSGFSDHISYGLNNLCMIATWHIIYINQWVKLSETASIPFILSGFRYPTSEPQAEHRNRRQSSTDRTVRTAPVQNQALSMGRFHGGAGRGTEQKRAVSIARFKFKTTSLLSIACCRESECACEWEYEHERRNFQYAQTTIDFCFRIQSFFNTWRTKQEQHRNLHHPSVKHRLAKP